MLFGQIDHDVRVGLQAGFKYTKKSSHVPYPIQGHAMGAVGRQCIQVEAAKGPVNVLSIALIDVIPWLTTNRPTGSRSEYWAEKASRFGALISREAVHREVQWYLSATTRLRHYI